MFCANYVNELLSQGLFMATVAMNVGIVTVTACYIVAEPLRSGLARLIGSTRRSVQNESAPIFIARDGEIHSHPVEHYGASRPWKK